MARRQAGEISRGGLPALLRTLAGLAVLAAAFWVVVVMRLLRPFILFRFGGLLSQRIGHFSGDIEVYLCERDLGMHGSWTLDLFYKSSEVSNSQLSKMWGRKLNISRFARYLDRINRRIPGGASHMIPWRRYQYRDIHGVLAETSPHISFTADEVEQGRSALRGLGLQDEDQFICFLARDPAYLDSLQPSKSWRYHDYRNSSISGYLPAASALTSRGYFAFRMGALIQEHIETEDPKIIDYAAMHRTEFLDIYLSANCRFFLSSGSGIDNVAMMFRRPTLFVNYAPLDWAHFWDPRHLFIPKKAWLRGENRFMTFPEILDSGVGRFGKSEQYEEFGIDLVENTSEEITAVTLEMDDRLDGVWQTSTEDEELQQQFRSLFSPGVLHGPMNSRIGAEYLRQNRELLA